MYTYTTQIWCVSKFVCMVKVERIHGKAPSISSSSSSTGSTQKAINHKEKERERERPQGRKVDEAPGGSDDDSVKVGKRQVLDDEVHSHARARDDGMHVGERQVLDDEEDERLERLCVRQWGRDEGKVQACVAHWQKQFEIASE